MKKKEWTPHQKNRLPKDGYWLSFFDGGAKYTSTHAYCIMNGRIKYVRQDEVDGDTWGSVKEWSTLTWACMPTQKQIDNAGSETEWHYYKTHEEMIKANSDLPAQFHTKAPNDF